MKSALLVWGGSDGYEPKESVEQFIPFLRQQGFDVEMSNTLEVFLDEPKMQSLSLMVPCWTMGTIAWEQEKGLLAAVRNGAGIAGWHGGMGDAFRKNTEYQFMVGGQWVAHPDGIVEYIVNIVDRADLVTWGLNDFKMKSEQYYMHVDPSNRVLATTTFSPKSAPWTDGCVMPVVWKRHYGLGRVFYSSLGHLARDFDVPEAKEIMKRGLLWASK